MENLFIVIYAHYYDFEIYTECRVCAESNTATAVMRDYLRDIYEEEESEGMDFDVWCATHTKGSEFSFDKDGCEYYNVKIEQRGVDEGTKAVTAAAIAKAAME